MEFASKPIRLFLNLLALDGSKLIWAPSGYLAVVGSMLLRQPLGFLALVSATLLRRPFSYVSSVASISFRLALGALAILLFSCEGGVPEFTDLGGGRIPSPTFAGKSSTSITITSPFQVIPLSGECDSRVQSIDLKVNQFSDWGLPSEFTTVSPTFKCSDPSQNFFFSVKNLTDLGYWGNLSQPFSFQIFLRASTKAGLSAATVVTVKYEPKAPTKPPIGSISSGAKSASSNDYNLQGRTSFGSSSSASSGAYRIEGGISR